jgi:hypothetical protein
LFADIGAFVLRAIDTKLTVELLATLTTVFPPRLRHFS